MKVTFKKDRFLIFFFICLSSFLTLLFLNLFFLWQTEEKEVESSDRFYRSMSIANELRQSSDDLTKMIRLYVLTGNIQYVDRYKEILSIRNGTSPRPVDYNENYWDFVLEDGKRPRPYGEPISLKQMMINEGFSKEELDLLTKSQQLSDNLAGFEIEAIHIMQGHFADGSGGYVLGAPNPELARYLVSGKQYMQEKAKIMAPLLQFSLEVHKRTLSEMIKLRKDVVILILSAIVLSIFSGISLMICFLKSRKSFEEASSITDGLLLNVLPKPIADRLKKGEGTIVDECRASVLFVHIRHFAESFSVDTLNEVYERFDRLAERFGVEKIKVVGDCYVAVAGVPIAMKGHEVCLAEYALALRNNIEDFNKENGLDFSLRIGMSSGTVIAGIVGVKRFIYDLWGSVVTEASFLEASGVMGMIHVSEKMARILADRFELEERGKGDGEGSLEKTYFLIGKK